MDIWTLARVTLVCAVPAIAATFRSACMALAAAFRSACMAIAAAFKSARAINITLAWDGWAHPVPATPSHPNKTRSPAPSPAPGEGLARAAAVLPYDLVALNLVAWVCRVVEAARLVARPHMQAALAADEAVAEAPAIKVLQVTGLSHALVGWWLRVG